MELTEPDKLTIMLLLAGSRMESAMHGMAIAEAWDAASEEWRAWALECAGGVGGFAGGFGGDGGCGDGGGRGYGGDGGGGGFGGFGGFDGGGYGYGDGFGGGYGDGPRGVGFGFGVDSAALIDGRWYGRAEAREWVAEHARRLGTDGVDL